MLEQSPRIITWLSLAIMAVVMWWISGYVLEPPANLLPGLIAVVLIISAAVAGLDWLAWKASRRVDQYFQSRSITERVRAMEQIRQMTPEQIRFLENNSSVVSIIPGTPEPLYMVRLGTMEVPLTFVEQFIRLSDDTYLCPVSTWSEGSRHQEYARLITNRLILAGLAEQAAGNRPARWVSKADAMRWMGLE